MQQIGRLQKFNDRQRQRNHHTHDASEKIRKIIDIVAADALHTVGAMDATQVGETYAGVGDVGPLLSTYQVGLYRALDAQMLQCAHLLDTTSIRLVLKGFVQRKASHRSEPPVDILKACVSRFVELQNDMGDVEAVGVLRNLAELRMWQHVSVRQGKAIVQRIRQSVAHLPTPTFVSLLSSLAVFKWNVKDMSTEIMERAAEVTPTLAFVDTSRLIWALARLRVDLQCHTMRLLDARIGKLLTAVYPPSSGEYPDVSCCVDPTSMCMRVRMHMCMYV